jgi:uncharacterized protein with HEPN domain
MTRDVRVYLQDIMECIEAIEEYISSTSEDEFYQDRMKIDAVLRRLEIIGEAVKAVDEEFRNAHPEIPWKKMAGMRDVLIHEYFGVDMKRIWKVAKSDLPLLKQHFLKLL